MKPIKVKAEVVTGEISEDAVEVEATLVDSKKARKLLEARYDEAEKTIKDKAKLEELLLKMEEKLAKVPVAGKELSKLPLFGLLVHSYVAGEYTDPPIGTILAAAGAIIYFVNPFDIVPDAISALGFADDAAVAGAAYVLISSDLDDYIAWRAANKN